MKKRGGGVILYHIFIFIASIIYMAPSYADSVAGCVNNAMTITPIIRFDMPLVFPDNEPTGTVFATGSSPAQFRARVTTAERYVGSYDVYLKTPDHRIMTLGNGVSVYRTNIPGVGIAYPDGSVRSDAESREVYLYTNPVINDDNLVNINLRYQLVKTGNNVGSGSLSGNFGSFDLWCYPKGELLNGGPGSFGQTLNVVGNPVIMNAPCRVIHDDIKVSMGAISLNRFNGIGTTSAPRDFSIQLSCNAQPNVSFMVTPGPNGSLDIDKGILNLNNPADSTTAKGVGLQVLFKHSPLKFNQNTAAGAATQNFEIPLQVQYIQTESQVSAGTANASAAFIISYN
ncbi:MAG: fimbrial protein [Scandinavium sp.]|uniref:fimbrial protein n=1 Tax=Scandinavium sp. TaxID=2830653 RepID=UPI003F4121A7